MRALAIGDVHGNLPLLERLLRETGVIDGDGNRVDVETTVVHVGDLANCVRSSIEDDLACLAKAHEWFDVVLVGNHELPYFGGSLFSGFYHDVEIDLRLRDLEESGLIQPSVEIDGVLLTHAGATVEMAAADGDQDPGWATAEAANDEIRWAWTQNHDFPLFSRVGRRRGGWHETGGILWADYDEEKTLAFSQVFGHTPGNDFRQVNGDGTFALCIDLGGGKGRGRLGGVVLEEGKPTTVRTALSGEFVPG